MARGNNSEKNNLENRIASFEKVGTASKTKHHKPGSQKK